MTAPTFVMQSSNITLKLYAVNHLKQKIQLTRIAFGKKKEELNKKKLSDREKRRKKKQTNIKFKIINVL